MRLYFHLPNNIWLALTSYLDSDVQVGASQEETVSQKAQKKKNKPKDSGLYVRKSKVQI